LGGQKKQERQIPSWWGQVLLFAFTNTKAIYANALGKKQDLTPLMSRLTIDLLVAYQAATNVKW